MFAPYTNFIEHACGYAQEKVEPKHDILSAGTEVTLLGAGVLKFEPNTASNAALVISCGVSGDSKESVELVNRMVDDLLAEDQKCGQRVLFIIGNPLALTQIASQGSIDLDTLFCGKWTKADLTAPEVKRAAIIEAYIANFFAEAPVTVTQHWHFDLQHSTTGEDIAEYPMHSSRSVSDAQKAFLSRAGVKRLVLSNSEENRLVDFTARKQQADGGLLFLADLNVTTERDRLRQSSVDYALREMIAGEPLPTSIADDLLVLSSEK